MKKRTLSLLLVIVMLLSLVPANMLAATGETGDGSGATLNATVYEKAAFGSADSGVLVAGGYAFNWATGGSYNDGTAVVDYAVNKVAASGATEWTLAESDGAYSMQNAATEKYLSSSHSALGYSFSSSNSAVYWTVNDGVFNRNTNSSYYSYILLGTGKNAGKFAAGGNGSNNAQFTFYKKLCDAELTVKNAERKYDGSVLLPAVIGENALPDGFVVKYGAVSGKTTTWYEEDNATQANGFSVGQSGKDTTATVPVGLFLGDTLFDSVNAQVKILDERSDPELELDEDAEYGMVPGVNVTADTRAAAEQGVLEALLDSSAPDLLTEYGKGQVTVQFLSYDGSTEHWEDLDGRYWFSSGIHGHYFGEEATETVRITFKGDSQYKGKTWELPLHIIDSRTPTLIVPKDGTVTVDLGDDYAAAIVDQLKIVEKENTANEVTGVITLASIGSIKHAGDITVKVSYAGSNTYQPVSEQEITVTVNDKPHYVIEWTAKPDGGSVSVDKDELVIWEEGNDAPGFTVTATPTNSSTSNNYCTVSICVTNQYGDVLGSSGEGVNTLTVPGTAIESGDTLTVAVSFAKAAMTLQNGDVESDWTAANLKQRIFDAVVKSVVPEAITADDVTIEYYAYKSGSTSSYYKPLNYSPENDNYHAFRNTVGQTEKVRITYSYNGRQVLKDTATVTIISPRKETVIVPANGISPVQIPQGTADYVAALKDKLAVQVKDGDVIAGAADTLTVTGLDEHKVGEAQDVTVSYAGDKTNYRPCETTISVEIIPADHYKVNLVTVGAGTVSANGKPSASQPWDIALANDLTVEATAGDAGTKRDPKPYYFRSIVVTDSEGAEIAALKWDDAAVLSIKTGDKNTLTVPAAKFENNGEYTVTVTFEPEETDLPGEGIVDCLWTEDTLADMVYEAAFKNDTPAGVYPNGIRTFYYKAGTTSLGWEELNFTYVYLSLAPKTPLTGYHEFSHDDGDKETVRLQYDYKGVSITKRAVVKITDLREEAEIKAKSELVIGYYDGMAAITKEDIFNAVVDVSASTPNDLSVDDVTIKYFSLTTYEELGEGSRIFGSREQESVQIIFAGNDDYKPYTLTVTVSIVDPRDDAAPVFKDDAALNYYQYFDVEKKELLDTATKEVLEQAVLAAVLNSEEEQLPDLLEEYAAGHVTVKYKAGLYINGADRWEKLTFTPDSILDLGLHGFGTKGMDSTEQLLIVFAGSELYKPGEWTRELTLSDLRIPTEFSVSYTKLESGVAELFNRMGISADKVIPVQYSAEKTMKEELISRLSVISNDGSPDPEVDADTQITVSPDMLNVRLLRTQKLTLEYAGDTEYKPCTAEITVYVLQAPADLDVDSKIVTYTGDAYDVKQMVDAEPEDLRYFTVTAGIQGDAAGFVSLDISESAQKRLTIDLYDMITAPVRQSAETFGIADIINYWSSRSELIKGLVEKSEQDTRSNIDAMIREIDPLASVSGAKLNLYGTMVNHLNNTSLADFSKSVEGIRKLLEMQFGDKTIGELLGTDMTLFEKILDLLTGNFEGADTVLDNEIIAGFSERMKELAGKFIISIGKQPSEAGIYWVSALSSDFNYELSYGLGQLTIKQKTEDISLEWNEELPAETTTNELGVTLPTFSYEDALKFGFGGYLAENEVKLGDAEQKFVHSIYGGVQPRELLPALDNDAITDPGDYVETIYVFGGNYYAEPIVRAYRVARAHVALTVDDVTRVVYDGERQSVKVSALVEGSFDPDYDPNEHLIVTYVSALNPIYPLTTVPPTEAGTYVVTVTYPGDSYREPAVKVVSLIIEEAEPTVTLEEKTVTYNALPQLIGTADVELPVEGETYGRDNKGLIIYTYFTDPECKHMTTISGDGALLPGQAPVFAGTYYVKAYLSAYGNYTDAVSNVVKLTVEKANPELTIVNQSCTYDGKPHAGLAAVELVGAGNTLESVYGKDAIQYTYYKSYDPDTDTLSDPVDGMPVNAGVYYVEASLAESRNFNAVTSHLTGKGAPGTLTIGKAKLTISADSKKIYVNDKNPVEMSYTQTGLCNPPDEIILACPTLDVAKVGQYAIVLVNRDALEQNYDITMNDAVVEVVRRPVGNPAITVHVYGESKETDVVANASGSTVEIRETLIDDIDAVIDEKVRTVVVTMDLTDTERAVDTVVVPVKVLEKILDAMEDADNDTCLLRVKFADGKALFDADALRELLADADGKTVEIALAEYEGFVCGKDENCILAGYADLKPDAWYHDGVHYCLVRGLMTGKTDSVFAPDGLVNRQQVWMILARLSGEKPANMAEARAWAMKSDISDGSNPTNTVTRQQLAAMLYRYAQQQGKGFTGEWFFLLDCTDRDSIASYAYEAMCWCNMNKIIGGFADGTVRPTATATRAQMAAMLQRFCENV